MSIQTDPFSMDTFEPNLALIIDNNDFRLFQIQSYLLKGKLFKSVIMLPSAVTATDFFLKESQQLKNGYNLVIYNLNPNLKEECVFADVLLMHLIKRSNTYLVGMDLNNHSTQCAGKKEYLSSNLDVFYKKEISNKGIIKILENFKMEMKKVQIENFVS